MGMHRTSISRFRAVLGAVVFIGRLVVLAGALGLLHGSPGVSLVFIAGGIGWPRQRALAGWREVGR